MNQENILEKMKDAGMVDEAVSAETMIKEKSMVLQIGESLIIVNPNGKIMEHTATSFRKENYKEKVLDFVHMEEMNHYNPLHYLRNEADVMSFARYLINKMEKNEESFMLGSEIALLTALICYVKMERPEKDQNFASIMKMLRVTQVNAMDPNAESNLDVIFDNLERKNPEHIAVKQWKIFKLNHPHDQERVITSLAAKLSIFNLPMIEKITSTDDLELDQMKDQTTVLFVKIPTINDSYDILTELLCFQLMNMKDCDHVSGWKEYQRNKKHEDDLLKDIREISAAAERAMFDSIWEFEEKEK